jgi:L,D-peptidoglycan transpeptidase YkuD (ErfK/YbiS/YcfS/YnhG family)
MRGRRGGTLTAIDVRRRPGHRSQGLLVIGHRAIAVTIGRAGIRTNKREGDGSTPAGRFRPLRVWWRADRGRRPRTVLPIRRIGPDTAWCEDPSDRRYNRPFRRSANEPGDRLWRDDRLYDVLIEIDHNARPRVAGRGSAVFLHVVRPDRGPTAGCVAMAANDLRRALAQLSSRTRIIIHF